MRFGKTVAFLTAFLFLAAGAWAQTENILNNFDYSNGGYMQGPVVLDSSGNVYGIAPYGGNSYCGVVYQLVNNSGTWSENELYSFTCGTDGGYPYTNGLAIDSSGNLYGTSYQFGAYGKGTVFELVNSSGTYTFDLLYSFTGEADGAYPYAGPTVDSEGNLYGTTYQGGGGGCYGGCGTVWELVNKNGTWKEKVLHLFVDNGKDGWYPYSPVTLDKGGNLYGTTVSGSGFQYGAVYKLAKPKKGAWKETILHYFYGGDDGCNPYSGVVADKSGNLYGTTASCGESSIGTVYQLKKAGKKYTNNVILNFNDSNGYYPYDYGTVALDSSGNVYGTAYYGGAYYYGTVFELAAGTWSYTDLHDFDYNGTDGGYAYSGLTIDSSGNVYGTTELGGNESYGIVYQIVPGGRKTTVERTAVHK
jgi:uncharacterized repeat protein (TIGR03803 family)